MVRRSKAFKRLLALSLALAAVFSLAGSAFALNAGYKDVPADAWYASNLSDLSAAGVVSGYPDGTYRPGGSVTVAEAVKLLVLAAGYSEQTDPAKDWKTPYLDFALKRGFIDQNEYNAADRAATRLQVAHIAAKCAGLQKARHMENPFADTQDGYVLELYKVGVLTGSVEGDKRVFKPDTSISRAEMCAIVWRVRNGDIHKDQIRVDWYWADVLPDMPLNPYAAECFGTTGDRASYTPAGAQTITGVDVSYWQGDVDWAAVKADGIGFAMLRLGYRGYGQAGNLMLDEKFQQNAKNAVAAGLPVGVYFYSQATTVAEAKEEAAFVLKALSGAKITWPVVFDWEIPNDTARTVNVDVDTLTACADAFCKDIAAAGYKPMIYFGDAVGYLHYDLSLLKQYDFWYAGFRDSVPAFRYDFKMWQYTEKGKVKGISGDADLNLSFVDYGKASA